MTFWWGSGSGWGSADPCLWLMDPVPDPAVVIDLQDANKKLIKKKVFLLITFWRYIYIILKRWKVKKKSQNSRNQVFSYFFGLLIEGSIPLVSGSGSGSRRPKNIRIRIHNTACHSFHLSQFTVVPDTHMIEPPFLLMSLNSCWRRSVS